MKPVAIISLVFGIIALGAALYCQFEVIPAMKSIDRASLGGKLDIESAAFKAYRELWMQKEGLKGTLNAITLVGGGLGLLGGIVAGIKQTKLGWISAAVSAVALVLGLLQGTHLFS